MHLALVTNDKSGGATDPDHLAAALGADGSTVDVVDIEEHERAAASGADRVVVAGGDGSIGPVAAVCAAARLPLAVVPAGTANDFARALSIPLDVDAACALARSSRAETVEVELHRAAGRPFLNAASAGLSVAAAERADELKEQFGPLAYAVGAVRAGTAEDPFAVRVLVDGAELFDGEAWQVIVAGTGAFGGGSQIGGTDRADGRLDVAVLPASGRAGLLRRALGMRRGTLVDQKDVRHARGTRVEVVGAPGGFNVDGEVCDVEGGLFVHEGERVSIVVPTP